MAQLPVIEDAKERLWPWLTVREQARVEHIEPAQPEKLPESPRELARLIDHTLLAADATPQDVARLCDEAKKWETASVCVNSRFVPLAAKALLSTPVRVAAVVGFPLGAMLLEAKTYEAQAAVAAGAGELDWVIAVGFIKAGEWAAILDELRAGREAAPASVFKIILETGYLTDLEKVMAALASVAVGADFVKTSTGFGPGGATAEDVGLLRLTVGRAAGVKASGGIRHWSQARELIQAGANRLGMSQTGTILEEFSRHD